MAQFEVKVYPLTILPHPNADAIELAQVGDYRSIVLKGQFRDGDLGAYIPEGSVVPAPIIAELGLEGRLAGPKHDRVKAIKLRGILSQGLIYPAPGAQAGDDLTEALGITKYEPPIPDNMSGEVWNAFGLTLRSSLTEIWDIKKFPGILQPGQPVVITEKIHGTWCCLGLADGQPVVASKGLSAQGLAFQDNEANRENLYMRQWHRLKDDVAALLPGESHVYLLGEIYGNEVQDLKYEVPEGQEFRAFDLYVGQPPTGRYLEREEMETLLPSRIPAVPVLYRGPYDRQILENQSAGKSAIAGHMREGAVVKATPEQNDPDAGRMCFKSFSESYLLREGGTEFS